MKIAILSDSHDHIWNLEKVLNDIKGKTDALIHCGDFIAPFVPSMLARLNIPVYACLGNNDEDQIGLLKLGSKLFKWTFLGEEFGQIELDSRKIVYCHYPKLGELLAKTEEYDAVFYGHTHEAVNKKVGNTLLVNPGAICGITAKVVLEGKGEHEPASYAIYDTKKNIAEIVQIR